VERADADRGAGLDIGVPGDGHVDLAGAHRDAEGGPAGRELEPGQVEVEEAGGMAVRRLEIGHQAWGDRPAARLPVDPGEGAGPVSAGARGAAEAGGQKGGGAGGGGGGAGPADPRGEAAGAGAGPGGEAGAPEPGGPEPGGPEPDGPEPDGPEPDGPEPDGPE